ncbi:CBS domain-containing protein [TM7 phylum sp. oral taxon 350]|nr:CBS domain-containing protein [TM7 phylum sp. oral taxon 350]
MVQLVIIAFLFLITLLFACLKPIRSSYSAFEVNRLKAHKTKSLEFDRFFNQAKIEVLFQALTFVSFFILTVYVTINFNLFFVVLLELFLVLLLEFLRGQEIVNGFTFKLYKRYEKLLLKFSNKYDNILSFFVAKDRNVRSSLKVHSKEELFYLLDNSKLLLEDEMLLLRASFDFKKLLIKDIMVPLEEAVTIRGDELLGPLVINELHKTKHTIFPVMRSEGEVIGLLNLVDVTKVNSETKSLRAIDLMKEDVFFVGQDKNLEEALGAFLRSHQHLFIVVNKSKKAIGLVCLEDIIERLLGRKIAKR